MPDSPPATPAISAAGQALLHTIARIRVFELRLLRLFGEGKLFGTTHTCIGQEACAAALYRHVDPARDAAFSNHRCHGHYLAWGGSPRRLLAEIMGREGGVCQGRGGSQHLCEGRFYTQGVQGGSMPIAAGYAERLRGERRQGIVVAHIGDGTLGEGVVYEALNIIALRSLPVLIVLEYNGVAQSTDTSTTTAGDIAARFEAFGLEVDRCRVSDPEPLAEHLGRMVERVRSGRPLVQILDTFRLMAHSKSDDDRDPAALKAAWEQDYFDRLLKQGHPAAVAAWDQAEAETDEIAAELEAAPLAKLSDAGAFAPPAKRLFESSSDLVLPAGHPHATRRINEALAATFDHCLERDADLLVVGEDLLDPYGGAFKATKGLSTKYPQRVFSTPISEAAIVGFSSGWALAGGKAAVEIMFGDFALLAADQIVNQAAKMHYMYGGKVAVPLTVRLVSGGYRGYGPTHSQSLEARFCGAPGLRVVALSRRHNPEALVSAAVLGDPNPVLLVEHKLLYGVRPHSAPPAGLRFVPSEEFADDEYPPLRYSPAIESDSADVTLVTYGGMTDLVEEALAGLMADEELKFDYFVLTQLSSLSPGEIVDSVRRTRRLVVVEEGPQQFGIGAELAAQVSGAIPELPLRIARVGARLVPIPNSRVQEREALPSRESIVAAVMGLI